MLQLVDFFSHLPPAPAIDHPIPRLGSPDEIFEIQSSSPPAARAQVAGRSFTLSFLSGNVGRETQWILTLGGKVVSLHQGIHGLQPFNTR